MPIYLVGQYQEDRKEDQVAEVDSFHLGVLVEVEDPWFREDLVEVANSYCLDDLGVVVDSFHLGVLGDSYRLEDQGEEASLKILELDLGDLELGGLVEEEELLVVLFASLVGSASDSKLKKETC